MDRKFQFYVNPNTSPDNLVTPRTIEVTSGNAAAIIEMRLPSKGERGWQCWTNTPIDQTLREMFADWGADGPGWVSNGPGWVSNGSEENGESDGEHGLSFHITILAAFRIDAWTFPSCRMFSQDELVKAQGFKPGRTTAPRDGNRDPLEPPKGGEAKFWLDQIMPSINRLEEIGGPSDADYLEVLEYVSADTARRVRALKGSLSRTEVADPAPEPDAPTITIELTISGDLDRAQSAVESALDSGAIQEAISDAAEAFDGDDYEITNAEAL